MTERATSVSMRGKEQKTRVGWAGKAAIGLTAAAAAAYGVYLWGSPSAHRHVEEVLGETIVVRKR